MPVDTPDPVGQENEFYRMAVPMSDIVHRAEEATLKHAFFAFEACYAGNVITSLHSLSGDEPPRPNLKGYVLNPDTQKPVRQFLTAGNSIQEIPADNSFTAVLAEALSSPDADTNHDGFITGKKVMSFVQQKLPLWATKYPRRPETGSSPIDGGDMVFGPIAGLSQSLRVPPPSLFDVMPRLLANPLSQERTEPLPSTRRTETELPSVDCQWITEQTLVDGVATWATECVK